MRLIIKLYIIVLFVCCNIKSLYADTDNTKSTTEILLIGSSYFNYNNLVNILKRLVTEEEIDVYFEMQGENGTFLADHAISDATEAKIKERQWDYVILQGEGSSVAYSDYFTEKPIFAALSTLKQKIKANSELTRIVFAMPWAFEDGMTWYQNWTDSYEDMQGLIYSETLKKSVEIGFEIAPVGWVWNKVLREYDYPLHYLHMSDWNHPTFKGSYLMACVLYSTIFQKSTINFPTHAEISSEESLLFHTLASNTVLENLELWNIELLFTGNNDEANKNKPFLQQNFPNPFQNETIIQYSISNQLNVNLIIFDSFNRPIMNLVDEEQTAGDYEITFEGNGLSSGLYFYQLTAGSKQETKKMILYQ